MICSTNQLTSFYTIGRCSGAFKGYRNMPLARTGLTRFIRNIPFDPLKNNKTFENERFSDVFKGIKRGNWGEKC